MDCGKRVANLTFEIIDLEWDMFENVQGINGRASCQDNKSRFYVMRFSQHHVFTEQFLKSYLFDLMSARENGRNLVEEKYAWMMKLTNPRYFRETLLPFLPSLNNEELKIEQYILKELHLMQDDLIKKCPRIVGSIRPTSSSEMETSTLDYMKGELRTYSLRTLRTLLSDIRLAKEKEINLVECIIRMTLSFTSREAEVFNLRNEYNGKV